MHISVKRTAALDLLRRGLITQAEAAKLTCESQQVISYLARDIDYKAARAKQIDSIWKKEIAKHGT
jgi:hypothetical protein